MTTTISSPPTVSQKIAAGTANAGPHSIKRHRSRSVGLLALAGVAVLSIAGWAAYSRMWGGRAAEAVDRHTVGQRSFAVMLKEKGELKACKSTDIKCEVEGRSTVISLVAEGTAVKEGDLLVELASAEIDNRIRAEEIKESNALTVFESARTELEIQRDRNASDVRKGDLAIELKRLALARYENGEWVQQTKDADVAIEQAEITLERREQDWKAAEELFKRKFITQTEYEEDDFNYQKARWDLDKAKMAKSVLETYTHVVDFRQKQSDFDEAVQECGRVKKGAIAEETRKTRSLEGAEKELSLIRDQLAKLRTQKEKCRITAPTQGFVVYYSENSRWGGGSDDQIKEGAEVFERQVLMQLPDTSQMMVVVRVHEAKTDKLHVGQRVSVQVEGIADKQFAGAVGKIAVLADSQNRWLNPDLKEYETEIVLDATDVPLKPGVTAHAEIMVEPAQERLAVPVQAVYTKSGRRYVFREGAGGAAPIEVKLGSIGTEWAEITEGVKNDDRILLTVSDDQKRQIPDLPVMDRRGGPPSTRRAGMGTGAAAPSGAGGKPGGSAGGKPSAGR